MSELFLEQTDQVLADWDGYSERLSNLADGMRWTPPGHPADVELAPGEYVTVAYDARGPSSPTITVPGSWFIYETIPDTELVHLRPADVAERIARVRLERHLALDHGTMLSEAIRRVVDELHDDIRDLAAVTRLPGDTPNHPADA